MFIHCQACITCFHYHGTGPLCENLLTPGWTCYVRCYSCRLDISRGQSSWKSLINNNFDVNVSELVQINIWNYNKVSKIRNTLRNIVMIAMVDLWIPPSIIFSFRELGVKETS